MKKAIKKLMAALLAVAMLCALAVPAFADDSSNATTTETGSITVTNAVKDMTYHIYRILDIDTHDTAYSSIVYKTNQKWSGFINDVNAGNKYFTKIDTNGVVTVKDGLTAADASDLATAAKTWLNSHNITEDATPVKASGNTVQFNNLALGYYMVVSTGWDATHTVICSLNTTKPHIDIEEKNGKPTIVKKIIENSTPTDKNDAGIGDYVKFRITVNVIDGKPLNYVIHDTMSKGLSFVNNTEYSLVVKKNDTELASSNYEIINTGLTDSCTFEVKINDGVLASNDIVTVEYYGQINNQAEIITKPNTNSAKLTYGTNGEAKSNPTNTYVWGFKVHKRSGSSDTLLAGAQFRLYKTVGNDNYYAKFQSGLLNGWTTAETEATILTSDATSDIVLNGLDSGVYYLEETKAPEGYNKLTAPVKVTISDTGSVTSIANDAAAGTAPTTATDGVINVINNTGTTLPTTGGIGTTIFYVIGGGLMLAAAVLLITKKRMENKN